MKPTTEKNVYAIVSRNGAIKPNQRPSEAQLRLYCSLIVKTGARFDCDQYTTDSWRGRTMWQMSRMIDTLQAEAAKLGLGR